MIDKPDNTRVRLDIKSAEISYEFMDDGKPRMKLRGFLSIDIGGQRIVAGLHPCNLIIALCAAANQRAE